ncbi:MAG: phosphoenolpyruvate--protein phosphotransferase [Ardenticatenia bacterium]|nr:phosphoenolpyruvate--protein phosphotransferase [Ardenticatenia bacterium]
MVSLVIVAHSLRLAEGIKEMADQMVQGKVAIAVAGGIDDPEHPLGTDAERVRQAIESVYSDEGVIIFVDLGSAILSAEVAIDMLPPERRAHVYVSGAPLVEGVLSAAVQAAAGSPVDVVLAEVRTALVAKERQVTGSVAEQPQVSMVAEATGAAAPSVRVKVRNRLGLHARPAARFVTTAARFNATITVQNLTRATPPVNAKSINQVATLGAQQGHELLIVAQGPDAQQALATLAHLVEHELEEAAPEPPPVSSTPPTPEATQEKGLPAHANHFKGVPASPGVAVGPAFLYHPASPHVTRRHADNVEEEWERLRQAIAAAREEIERLRSRAARQAGQEEAAIFDAHLLMLDDPAVLEGARERLFAERLSAEAAWEAAVEHVLAQYRQLDDPYLQARAADMADVGQRVLRLLTGTTTNPVQPDKPCVLVAADLTPSDTAQLDPEHVLGICTALGGPTSHSAILARALGIPAVVGVGAEILRVPEGEEIALDGHTGDVWVAPDEARREALLRARAQWTADRQAAQAEAHGQAMTQDGHRVPVLANIRGLSDARLALEHGAEGVGLLRTEFLFLERLTPPEEDEQVTVYKAIAETLGARPLVIRTLDVGGDKPLPYVTLDPEDNPFLGLRGVRFSLAHPELLKTQLRAILRASPEYHFKVMFPMVADLSELRQIKALWQDVVREVEAAGLPHAANLPVGIMVEVPAAAELADVLAPEVDFFSVGTNDLSQYTLAADRTNPHVAPLADALHPAVLRLIRRTVEAAQRTGIPVSVCGEVAGDPVAVPVLVGLGVNELSVNPPAVPVVKATLRRFTLEHARTLAAEVLEMSSAQEVRAHVRAVLGTD